MSLGTNDWGAALYLEKGHLFEGRGFGARRPMGGEAVFNTGMAGYQEVFSDPSYCRQIVVMSAPQIGNTGVNWDDPESIGLDLSGVVVREYCESPSSWRATLSLGAYLEKANVPGIHDVDTREITQCLRDEGAQRAVIFPTVDAGGDLVLYGKKLLGEVPEMEGLELVSQVSCKSPYEFGQKAEHGAPTAVVYDYGVKHGILRQLKKRGFKVQVVPYRMPYQEAMAYRPAVVVLSNGPGDPGTVQGATEEIQGLLGKVPILAICMGHQLLARALGSTTYKLKFGHHGVNHPVKDLMLNRILITSQNHGFAVRAEDLKSKDLKLSHVNLNDQTVEGFTSEKLRFYSVQFHPEARPGPNDAEYIFDTFIRGFVR
jgi:carbamoyl-phosphate synthase small subunit